MPNAIRIIVADAHPLIHTGIRVELAVTGSLRVVAEASSFADAVGWCRTVQPDLLLLDTTLLSESLSTSVQALRAVCPTLKILVLSADTSALDVTTLVAAGVDGYVGQDATPQLLISAIHAVVRGERWYSSTNAMSEAPASTAARNDRG